MAYLNKQEFQQTILLTQQIVDEVKNYVAKERSKRPYSYKKFYEETNISHTSFESILANKNRSITLDTATRLLDKCGYRLKIVPKIMPRSFYDHKDIIPPSDYATSSE